MLVYQRVGDLVGSGLLRYEAKRERTEFPEPAPCSVPLGQPTRTSKWQFAARSFNPTACVGGLVASSEPLKNGCIGKL